MTERRNVSTLERLNVAPLLFSEGRQRVNYQRYEAKSDRAANDSTRYQSSR